MTNSAVRHALVGVAAAFCFAVDSASAQSALARVRAGGQLRIGTDATYPPFASAQGGEFSGFDIDLPLDTGMKNGCERSSAAVPLPGIALECAQHDIINPCRQGVAAAGNRRRHGILLEASANSGVPRRWFLG